MTPIPFLLIALPLIWLAYEDYKTMYVTLWHAYVAFACIALSILISLFHQPNIALLQIIIGSAIFLIVSGQLWQLFKEIDTKLIYLCLIFATAPTLMAMLLLLGFTIILARMQPGRREYPAIARFAAVFIPVLFLVSFVIPL